MYAGIKNKTNKILGIERTKHGYLLVRRNTKILSVVKDIRYSIMIETKIHGGLEDRSDKYATFSNSRPVVWTNNSLFQMQWPESELANSASSG